MGVNISPDIFQEKISRLMLGLELVNHMYSDTLLILSNVNFEQHLRQLTRVLQQLRRAGLKVNAKSHPSFHQR